MGNCLQCGGMLNLNINLDEELQHILCPLRDASLLREEMDALRSTQEDVEQKIRVLEGDPCKRVLHEAHRWVASVKEHDSKLKEILRSLNHNNCPPSSSSRFHGLCCCVCLNHSLGVEIKNELLVVRLRKRQRDNWGGTLAEDVPLQYNRRFSERLGNNNVDSTVGVEDKMSSVLQYLKDDQIAVVGIYGMGGAGKTTLINQVISRLWPSSPEEEPIIKFESIISVVGSQNLDVRRIQDEIAEQLGLSTSELSRIGDDDRARAGLLSAWLSQRKSLLVLDDVWEAVDLKRIVIPPELLRGKFSDRCGCKVVLTTRDENVCVGMGCQRRVKVGCLGMEHSWELFRIAIRWDDDDDWFESVSGIAEEIVRRCGGLPLVLVTVARAMATKRTITEWRDAEEALKDSPHEIRGMEDVFRLLKFSYDNLEDDEHRSCLLYSALFPEDHKILIDEMVDYCIGAGSVCGNTIDDGSSSSNRSFDIEILRRNGRNTISGLIDACLLERRVDLGECPRVKVHDAIRDMILWLGEGEKEPHCSRRTRHKILSLAGKGLKGVYKIDEILWRDASMVSLCDNNIREVVVGHENPVGGCNSNVQVLLLCWNEYPKNLSGSLFEYFPNLRVLDLKRTVLGEIPASLCSLKSLQYLNMSHTKIKALPKEMGNLTNLLQLNLSFTEKLCEIPRGVFSSLSKLQSINLLYCEFFHCFTHHDKDKKAQVLKEVDDLPLRKDVRLSFAGNSDAVKFLVDELDMFFKSIMVLYIFGGGLMSDGLFPRIGPRLKQLKYLTINNFLEEDKEEDLLIDEGHFTQLKDLTIEDTNLLQRIILKGRVLKHLSQLEISNCNGLRDLACLWQLSNLYSLRIQDCDGIVEVLPPQSGGNGNQSCGITYHPDPLPKVQFISLASMKSLVRISSSPIFLRSLNHVWIQDCPSLKELWVVQSNSPDLTIRCTEMWWEGLEWENGAPPPNFIPKFGSSNWGDLHEEEEEEVVEKSSEFENQMEYKNI